MNKSESIKNLAIALSKFQGEVKNPGNTSVNPFFNSKYAPLETVLNTVKPVLAKYGLSVIQAPSTEDNNIVVTTILLHESGEFIESNPIKLKMDKITAQGAGSSITYARRYALSSILGIASEDDDDGNIAEGQAVKRPSISEAQIKRLYAIASSKDVDAAKVKEQIKTRFKKEVENLTKAEYDTVCKGYENMKGDSK